MNFLGHLYFSNNDTTLMRNNLFGDFVKGSALDHFPEDVQVGIVLHRSIDSFIDSHPTVKVLMRKLYAELPKVSGVAIDLFFDHLLAKNWAQFHPMELNAFLYRFYDSVQLDGFDYTDEFQEMIRKMIEINWISYYPTLDGLNKMCHGVASRISFPTQLINGVEVYLAHEEEIETAFFEFMSDAQYFFGNDIPK